ncbi:uncharacterized protein LOC142982664 [Anticarsia gemmatalis]|uniref:uncharacterized protein LOC142982664 n=1 Tax=Anticarsia gemmatalis TaxID=129554 RepID=UPI003F771160
MKFALLFLAILAVICLTSAIENRTDRKLINRPKIDIYGYRPKRAPQGGVKVHPLFNFRPTTTAPSLKKGEYMCGKKVCKLPPGVEPKNCNGECQYPIL